MATVGYMKPNTIWMGDLDPYMNDNFVMTAFRVCGMNPIAIRSVRKKNSDISAQYCFVDFESENVAKHVVRSLNGRILPGSNPPCRFRLSLANQLQSGTLTRGKDGAISMNEYSLFISNLTADVDDFILFRAFARHYPSVTGAKVIRERDGQSRGFGFVRFLDELDQRKALIEMQHQTGIGRRPIQISMASSMRKIDLPLEEKPGWTVKEKHEEKAGDKSKSEERSDKPDDEFSNYFHPELQKQYQRLQETYDECKALMENQQKSQQPHYEQYGEFFEYFQFYQQFYLEHYQKHQKEQMVQNIYNSEEVDHFSSLSDAEIVERDKDIFLENTEELFHALERSRWNYVSFPNQSLVGDKD